MPNTEQAQWESVLQLLTQDKVRTKFYRGHIQDIEQRPVEDGAIYFAYDNNPPALFIDARTTENGVTKVRRYEVKSSQGGGSGSAGYLYANGDEDVAKNLVKEHAEVDDLEDPYYFFYRSAFDNSLTSLPDVDTLIINDDGRFFRVVEKQGE